MPHPAQLDPLARAAVEAAERLGWSVFVEAAGARLQLGPRGRPGRDLVIVLGPPADAPDAPSVHPDVPRFASADAPATDRRRGRRRT